MVTRRLLVFAIFWMALAPAAGCLVPASRFYALKNQNESLVDRNYALRTEIENLRVHCRDTEDQLIRAERQLAMLEYSTNKTASFLGSEDPGRARSTDRAQRGHEPPSL